MAFLPLVIIVVILTIFVLWFFYKRSGNKQIIQSLEKNGNSRQMTSKVNFCGECGADLDGAERFCGKCGAEVMGF